MIRLKPATRNRRRQENTINAKSWFGSNPMRLGFVFLIAMAFVILGSCRAHEPSAKQPVASLEPIVVDESWRAEKPKSQEMAPLVFPQFEREVLGNGIEVWVVSGDHLPIVDVAFVTRAGSMQEPAGKEGLAGLTYDLLDEGTKTHDAFALSEAFQQLGTSLSVSQDREGGRLALRLLRRNLEPGLALLRDVILTPALKDEDFEKVKGRKKSYLQSRMASPRARAADGFVAVAYGLTHPYGKPAYGTLESVDQCKAEDVRAYWRDNTGPQNSALVFTGDIQLAKAVALAQNYFGNWENEVPSESAPILPEPPKTRIHLLAAAPGASQTVMFFGRPLTRWADTEDLFAASVMNQILGGMFSSRLNLNLREDKGWTYGASSQTTTRLGFGPFFATTSIKSEHSASAVKEIFSEFQRMRQQGVTAEELQLAKDNVIKSLPSRFETITAQSAAAEELFKNRLPADFFTMIPKNIKQVDGKAVQHMAKRALDPQGMTVVLVGDTKAISGPLEKLNSGEVVVWLEGQTPIR
jgi:zinc protease